MAHSSASGFAFATSSSISSSVEASNVATPPLMTPSPTGSSLFSDARPAKETCLTWLAEHMTLLMRSLQRYQLFGGPSPLKEVFGEVKIAMKSVNVFDHFFVL